MISSKYKDLYLSTSREQLKKLSTFLLYLEKKPQNQNLIENIFRLIHSMKGAAAAMAYKKTVKLLHLLENIIDSAYSGDIKLDKKGLELFFSTLDILKQNIESIDKKNREINLLGQSQRLADFLSVKAKKTKADKKTVKEKHILSSLPSVAEITVPTYKLDKIQNYLEDLLINILETKLLAEKSGDTGFLAKYLAAEKILGDMRRDLEKIRIVPLKQVFSSLPYLVREIANAEGKKIELVIEDNDFSLDKAILDELMEIVIQLLKNAAAHGIAKGQLNGRIVLSTALRDDRMIISVSDNGQGIDWQEILSLAVKNKIVSPVKAKKMTIAEIKNLIFVAGISKGIGLTFSSGRGIGLNLVKSKVEELSGSIDIVSEKGKGAKFVVDFPLPLSVFRALIIRIKDYRLALPLAYVDKVVKLEQEKDFSQTKTFRHDNHVFSVKLLDRLALKQNLPASYRYLLLVKRGKLKLALPVYGNISESELVMKKTPSVMLGQKYFKGAAISSKGRPVLVLDINNLF
ncbi:MAG: ATP-binding protein [Patescibacteria group bacterium]|nr:ATP-binding protein [Patescibacteria group bacterium]